MREIVSEVSVSGSEHNSWSRNRSNVHNVELQGAGSEQCDHLVHCLLHHESRQPSIQVDRIVEGLHAPGLEKLYIVLPFFQQAFGLEIQDEVADISVGRLCGSDIVQVAQIVWLVGLSRFTERMNALQKWFAVYLMFQKLCARVDDG